MQSHSFTFNGWFAAGLLASLPSGDSNPDCCGCWSLYAAADRRTSSSVRTTQPSTHPVPSSSSWTSIASCCNWSVVLMFVVFLVSLGFFSLVCAIISLVSSLQSCHESLPSASKKVYKSWLILHFMRSGSVPDPLSVSILSASIYSMTSIASIMGPASLNNCSRQLDRFTNILWNSSFLLMLMSLSSFLDWAMDGSLLAATATALLAAAGTKLAVRLPVPFQDSLSFLVDS